MSNMYIILSMILKQLTYIYVRQYIKCYAHIS